jgi:hypothetical protein
VTRTLLLCFGAFLVNLPFGYLRAGTRKFGWLWIVCVHAPVPLVIASRLIVGIGWRGVPFLIGASVAGQFAGGLMRRKPALPGH